MRRRFYRINNPAVICLERRRPGARLPGGIISLGRFGRRRSSSGEMTGAKRRVNGPSVAGRSSSSPALSLSAVSDVAVRAGRVQGVGGGQGRVDRRVRVHADRPQRRPVLRHRQPHAQAAHVRRRPVRHPVHGDRGRGHLGGRARVRRPGRPVLVRAAVPRAQRHAVRGVLPVPGRPAVARLRPGRRAGQVPRLLRRPADRHRVLLRAHRPLPGAHHQQHARRAPGTKRAHGPPTLPPNYPVPLRPANGWL